MVHHTTLMELAEVAGMAEAQLAIRVLFLGLEQLAEAEAQVLFGAEVKQDLMDI